MRLAIKESLPTKYRYNFQLTEIQSHYDEVQRQLQVTLDQYGVAQRRVQSLTGEIEEIRGNYEQVCFYSNVRTK